MRLRVVLQVNFVKEDIEMAMSFSILIAGIVANQLPVPKPLT